MISRWSAAASPPWIGIVRTRGSTSAARDRHGAAVVEPGAAHLDPLGKHKRALELARRDAAMQIDALPVIGLLARITSWLSSIVIVRSAS